MALADATVQAACDTIVVGPLGTVVPPDEVIGEWADSGEAVAGRLAGRAVARAVELVAGGSADGIVTAPLDKHALLLGGYDYAGHTEMLASLTGVPVAMMLASRTLRVVLATTHIPLRDVANALNAATIESVARTTIAGLQQWFGIPSPRVALCGLNPHLGDGGRFGSDDDEILRPAASRSGLLGPYAADTVFVRAIRGEFDAVIAPYHDVGMTAIKVASFGSAVNVTLGLPFPRTSPDHGTARDIAGTGTANPGSMIEAMLLAADIVVRRARVA